MFGAHAAADPTAIAIVDGDRLVSYGELDDRSSALCSSLSRRGVQCGDVVPIRLPRGTESIVAQLAVLRCGAAYLPIDATFPTLRQDALIAGSGAEFVITPGGVRSTRSDGVDPSAEIAPSRHRPLESASAASAPARPTSGSDLAYVMFTSGSTGHPKGVQVTHESIVNLVVDCDYVELTAETVVGQAATMAFDAATFEVWGALLNGGTICVLDPPILSGIGPALSAAAAGRPTVLFLTTMLFERLARFAPRTLRGVTWLLFGGERADPRVAADFVNGGFPGRLLHMYGPTETTTFATAYRVPAGLATGLRERLPVGRAIGGVDVVVVDENLQPAPTGIAGEVVIGGKGLACGYIGKPGADADRFLRSGSHGSTEKRYRTGDWGVVNQEGDLELLGRLDKQLKIRGFRIQPAEIESTILTHPSVTSAVVTAWGEASSRRILVAYVASEATEAELHAHLVLRLPQYMIPERIVVMPRLPLNANGKTDMAALPDPRLASNPSAPKGESP